MQSVRECVLLAFCGSIATTILLYVGHNHLASEQCYSFSCWLGCVSPQSQGSCWNSTLYSLRLSERIHRSSHSTVQHNELGNVNLEISRNFMSPFVLMSGSWQKECALPNKRNSYQQPYTCSQLYTSTSLCVSGFCYRLMSDVSWSPVVLSTQGMGGAQKALVWPALPVHLCAHGNGGKTVRGPRRRGERRLCLSTTWLLPFCLSVYSVFWPIMWEG